MTRQVPHRKTHPPFLLFICSGLLPNSGTSKLCISIEVCKWVYAWESVQGPSRYSVMIIIKNLKDIILKKWLIYFFIPPPWKKKINGLDSPEFPVLIVKQTDAGWENQSNMAPLSFSCLLIEFKIKLCFLQVSPWRLLSGVGGMEQMDFHCLIECILLFSISRRLEGIEGA
jgi:hypothetical protein